MFKIIIPNNNISERKYILDIVFNEFLGLDYKLILDNEKSKINDWIIELANDKILTIEDTFFNKYPTDLEYLKEENIPKSIKELDIFAACFFMLTRWEEYVNKTRDEHNRFPAYASLAYREGFLDKPIVNELIEEFKQQLLDLDNSLVFKEQEFELVLTHDVDEVKLWKNWNHVFRVVLGDIIKRKDIKLAYSRIKEYFFIKHEKIKDPYDTFDWLMDMSESLGLKSRFYFMSGGVTEYDNRYDIKTQKNLIKKIKSRGHLIGIHPSYNAYNNFEQLKREKELLESVCKYKIKEGREHYLRFEVPTTWQIWEDNGLEVDSTCGYADKEGYRCGTGNEFSVFNILTRKKLKLKERPLIVMDCSLFSYNNYAYEEVHIKLNKMKKHTNCFTILWHNSYIKYIDFYGDYLESTKK